MEHPDTCRVVWTLLAATVGLVVIYLYRHFTKLNRCGIPGPTPIPIFGNFLQVTSTGFGEIHSQWLKKYGGIYGYYMGYQKNISVADPDILKTILVKEFASFTDRAHSTNLPSLMKNGLFFMRSRQWKRTRNLLTPAFSAGKLKYMMGILNKCGETLAENLERQAGETAVLRKAFGQFTMDAIAATAFGIDIDSQKQPDEPFVTNIAKVFDFAKGPFTTVWGVLNATIPGLGRLLYKFGFTMWNKDAVAFYETTGLALIEERMKDKSERADFLNLMINSEFDTSKDQYIKHGATMARQPSGHTSAEQEGRLSLEEMNGSAFVFFLAGYETTASLLYFASYILAIHPDTDTRILVEINDVIGHDVPTYETLSRLTYMEQFIQEVLRLYPTVPRFNRLARQDVHIGGVVIPKGTVVNIPVWYIHHSDQFYTDPETFDPSRFDPAIKGHADSGTYLPFGMGPRHCIGMRLAMIEAKLALVHVLRKVRFERTENTQVPLQMGPPFGTLRPKQPIEVRLQTR